MELLRPFIDGAKRVDIVDTRIIVKYLFELAGETKRLNLFNDKFEFVIIPISIIDG